MRRDLSGTSGSAVAAWRETNGVASLLGGGAPLPSSRGTIFGVGRLSPAAAETTRYALLALSTSVGTANGVIAKETNSKMRYTRIGTAPTSGSSEGTVSPGQGFTFGFRQGTANAIAMLNGVSFSLGAGDIAGFTRFFVGTIGTTRWLGTVFEVGASNELLSASQFVDFHNAMKRHYSFIQ